MHNCGNCALWSEHTGECRPKAIPTSTIDWCDDWKPHPDMPEERCKELQSRVDGLMLEITHMQRTAVRRNRIIRRLRRRQSGWTAAKHELTALRQTMLAIATRITSEALRGVK